MKKLFIDTEFNGFGGQLISMAIVSQDGDQFYEMIELPSNPDHIDPWVSKHVIPLLKPYNFISYKEFQLRLEKFLSKYDHGFKIIADWPDDLRYFMQAIITGAGYMMNIESFEAEMCRELDAVKSKIPHNALEDAIAIMKSYEILND